MLTSVQEDDDFDIGSEPRCEVCGTVMRTVDGGYQCGGCGWELDVPWIERPTGGDNLPGIHGG
ncbi:hypothetical protein [Microbacterium plantarum]|uniref:Uncharacterized protein n=1 Tax=Microbacterium plantarum TaxID=1816425 RepID=A0ABV5EUD7_9MICO